MKLTGKQRAQLRGMANGLEPVFQIGKGGVGGNMADQVSLALEARELIKLTVLETADCTAREAANILSERTQSDVIQVIGRKFVLYRKSRENPKIELV